MFPTPIAHALFGRVFRDKLVEARVFFRSFTQNTAQSLHVLLYGRIAAQDDGDIGFGDIDSFIEHFRGDDGGEFSGIEGRQNGAAFFDARLMRNGG